MNMKTLAVVVGLALVGLVASAVSGGSIVDSEWMQFKSQHGKTYEHPAEESMRQAIFAKTKAYIEQFNKQGRGYSLAVNHMADWTSDELSKLNGFRSSSEARQNSPGAQRFFDQILSDPTAVPDSVDWRNVSGRVSPVKDQGQCGSCWAFATTGVLEGQEVARNSSLNSLVGLSEQDLVECSKKNHGCNGGIMSYALDDITEMGGIESEDDYPYTAKEGKCRFAKSKSVFSDKGFYVLPEGDEQTLKKVVAKYGPVSVAIEAMRDFMHYSEGVYEGPKECGTALNHGVLVVGYGTDAQDGDYWIVKNSWNTSWGQDGYVLMARNRKNRCGIASMATVAVFA